MAEKELNTVADVREYLKNKPTTNVGGKRQTRARAQIAAQEAEQAAAAAELAATELAAEEAAREEAEAVAAAKAARAARTPRQAAG